MSERSRNLGDETPLSEVDKIAGRLTLKLNVRKPKPGTPLLSPLRYPGSKRRLVEFIRRFIQINDLHPLLYAEPFAGGASVALQLLCDGIVDKIGLADADPLITSFWQCVFFDTTWLVEAIEQVDVTLECWQEFKELEPKDNRERALKCVFLNRTSFSGILASSAGPIGGKRQVSNYDITCRFPKKTVIKRILQASMFNDRVEFVWHLGWSQTLARIAELCGEYTPNTVFLYLDPPFYHKAERLYNYYFTEDEHKALHNALTRLAYPWLLSYDPAEPIELLYSSNGTKPGRIGMLYSAAASPSLSNAQELIVTNLPELPSTSTLWRVSHSSCT